MAQPKRHLLLSALLLLAVLACSEREPPKATSAPTPAAPAPLAAPGPADAQTGPGIAESDARAFLERWLALQNSGDLAGYSALYDAHFRGVKRAGPRVRTYDQKGWLADRATMFKRPIQVKATDVSVTTSARTAVVQFQQDWASGSYHDQGPKRMVLVRGAQGITITSEELLASEQFVPGDTQARIVVSSAKGPSYVLVAQTKLVPDLAQPVFAEAAYPAIAAYALPADAKAPELEPFLKKVHLIGSQGTCEVQVVAPRIVSVVYEHFGTIQTWRGESPGVPRASPVEIGRGMRELSSEAYLAVELERVCTVSPELALPASAGSKSPIPSRKVEAELQVLAKAAFAALPFVAKLSAEERAELLDVAAYEGFGAKKLEWIAVGGVTGCGTGVQGFALFRVKGKQLEAVLDSDRSELIWVASLVDLTGDGTPELVGTGSYGTPSLIVDFTGKALHTLRIPYFDCPC